MKSRYLFLALLTAIMLVTINSDASESPSFALFPVKVQGKWGYINNNGRLDMRPQFEEALSFSEGLAQVRTGNHWGYIDQTGAVVIAPAFSDAQSFDGELAIVEMNKAIGYVNRAGKIVHMTPYTELVAP